MKKKLLVLLCTVQACILRAQYKPVESKSSIKFSIKNFGIPVSGTFAGIGGNINFDPKHIEQGLFNVTIKSTTVNTDNNLRDDHLREETYFDSEHYPLISFASTRITTGNNGLFTVYGILTIKNHSKEVTVRFTAASTGDDYLFNGQFTVNRKDYAVGGNSIIADNATILLSVFATK